VTGIEPQPDEVVPQLLTAAELELADRPRRWLSRATVVTAAAAGWTLLLPWSYGRRIGLTVWQLGFEQHPVLGVVWALGTAAAITAVVLAEHRVLAAAGTAVAALVFTGWAWAGDDPELAAETWTGPGPALAGIAGLLWLLAALGQVVSSRRPEPALFTDYAIRDATGRLRHTRRERPVGDVRLRPGPGHPRE
jgi:hypothetical protein